MNSINIIGRLTKDVEIRYTTNNKMVASFGIAVRKDKENTNFFNCEAWGRTAELLRDYTNKGNMIGIFGELDNDNYEKDGKKVTRTKIVVRELTLIEKKQEVDMSKIDESGMIEQIEQAPDDDLPF